MAALSEAEYAKLINDCEIVIVPEESTIEEVLSRENQEITINNVRSEESGLTQFITSDHQDYEENFEAIYEFSKANLQNNVIITNHPGFSYLYSTSESSSKNNEENPERALMINKVLKENLRTTRKKIVAIIDKIDAQFVKNNNLLEKAKCSDKKDPANVKSSYIKCGSPFFKDALSNPAPFNEDYLHRKRNLNEFFPFDLPQTKSRWKTKDKVALITGVKQQMISHIKSKQCQKYSNESRKTRGRIEKLRFISQNQDLNKSAMLEIYETIQADYPEFEINWNIISFNDMESKHSVAECMGMWYSYLRPDINRDPFSQEENEKFTKAYEEYNFNNWMEIAALLNNRSCLQTFVHFHSTFIRYCPSNVRWSEAEDSNLIEMVEKYSINGIINWNKIGQVIRNRNKTQCYNRYLGITSRHGVKRGVFTPSEDRKVIQFVKKFGENNFKNLPKEFIPGRSKEQIRVHYDVALKHKGVVNPWTNGEDQQLMNFVEENGTNKWKEISDILKTHNRLSCRTRFMTIKKFLSKNPNATLENVPSKTKKVTAVQRSENYLSSVEETDESSGESDVKQSNKKVVLRAFEKFKASNPEMYKILRTSFNYDLGAPEVFADSTKLLMLMWLFNTGVEKLALCHPMLTAKQKEKFDEVKNYQLDKTLLDEMKFVRAHTQFLMPPNYNTVIGLRAIAIRMHGDPMNADGKPAITQQTKEYKESLESFQKLYFSLFYWSAMLIKIDNAELNEIHFAKYQKNHLTPSQLISIMRKRRLPVASSHMVKRSSNDPKTFPAAKKPKLF